MEINSTLSRYTMTDGSEVSLTLNFARLMVLKSNKQTKKDVEKGLAVLQNPKADLVDYAELLWLAYLCANSVVEYTRDEFMLSLGFDIEELGKVIEELTTSKKK